MNLSFRSKQMIVICLLLLLFQRVGINVWVRQYFNVNVCKETSVCLKAVDNKGKLHHPPILCCSANKVYYKATWETFVPTQAFRFTASTPEMPFRVFTSKKIFLRPLLSANVQLFRRGPPDNC